LKLVSMFNREKVGCILFFQLCLRLFSFGVGSFLTLRCLFRCLRLFLDLGAFRFRGRTFNLWNRLLLNRLLNKLSRLFPPKDRRLWQLWRRNSIGLNFLLEQCLGFLKVLMIQNHVESVIGSNELSFETPVDKGVEGHIG
jgi:hypothetical protein